MVTLQFSCQWLEPESRPGLSFLALEPAPSISDRSHGPVDGAQSV
jgi:hypothetical protein